MILVANSLSFVLLEWSWNRRSTKNKHEQLLTQEFAVLNIEKFYL